MQLVNVKNLFLSELGTIENAVIESEIKDFELTDDVEGRSVSGSLVLTKLDDSILVTGKFEAKVVAICDRCLDNFPFKVDFNLEREYIFDRLRKDNDNLYVDKYFNIDITEPIREELILTMPMKKICGENCKGICPGCGENLNQKKCRCEINPQG